MKTCKICGTTFDNNFSSKIMQQCPNGCVEVKPFEAQAFLTTGGIEIEINPAGDSLRWRYNFGEDKLDSKLDNSIHEAEIFYLLPAEMPAGEEAIAGFYVGETFYPLSEFMRL